VDEVGHIAKLFFFLHSFLKVKAGMSMLLLTTTGLYPRLFGCMNALVVVDVVCPNDHASVPPHLTSPHLGALFLLFFFSHDVFLFFFE
jgi:hypothetical protein